MANYNQLTKTQPRCGLDDPMRIDPVVPIQSSPIRAELNELNDAIERLDKLVFELTDKLRPIRALSDVPSTKTADGTATEPATGCELKDELAQRKQHILYIFRRLNEVKESLYI